MLSQVVSTFSSAFLVKRYFVVEFFTCVHCVPYGPVHNKITPGLCEGKKVLVRIQLSLIFMHATEMSMHLSLLDAEKALYRLSYKVIPRDTILNGVDMQ